MKAMKKMNTKETAMKPRFEEHDGKLFRILDEPVPLTPYAEVPCLIRLIQDDSPMGRTNKLMSSTAKCLDMIYTAINVESYSVESSVRELPFHCHAVYEIIGYPVEKGSNDWALYQMMQRKMVCHKKSPSITYCEHSGYIRREVRYNCVDHMSVSVWLNGADKNGWQIYKEPELKYKAGDFVEIRNWYSGTKHLAQIDSIDHEIHIGSHRFDTNGNSTMERLPQLKIIRKLKPSQVVVEIGCLSGAVKDLSYVEDGRFWFIGKKTERCPGGMHCILYLEMLDTQTRELVESLLKAQEKGE
jgi:hypothetical protein